MIHVPSLMLPLRKVIPMRFLLHSDSPLLLARDEFFSSLTTRTCGRQLALEKHEDGMSDKKYFVTVLGRHILGGTLPLGSIFSPKLFPL